MSKNRKKLIDFSQLHMTGVEAVAINNNRNNEDKIPASYIRLSDISNVNDQNKSNNSRLFALSFLLSTILLIICGGLGYSGFFSGSTSSETKGLMNELTKENTAVAESVMQNVVFEVDVNSNLKPYVKEEVRSIADNLPKWDVNNCEEAFFTQLSAISCESNKIMKNISPWPVGMGEKYFWVYKVMCCTFTVVKNEESINEIKVDDLDNPKSVITNLENFRNVEYQTWLDGCKKAPDPIGEKVIPMYMLLDDQTKEN